MIDYLRPYLINSEKVRLGPPEDGGYVTSKSSVEKSDCLVTYGVGNDTRYEEEYVTSGKHAFLYDHTIDGIGALGPNIHFEKTGLGFKEHCLDFLELWPYISKGDQKCLLKVDIEGDEYNYFPFVDAAKLAKICTGILIEVHWLDNIGYRNSFIEIAKNLEPYFVLTHIHGNSWGPLIDFEGKQIPLTVELSYDNRSMVEVIGLDKQVYPIPGIDFSNNPAVPDLDLKYIYE